MWVDSHCHLDFKDFQDDFTSVLERANAADVRHMLTVCTRPNALGAVLKLTQGSDSISCAVGVHPHNAGDFDSIDAEQIAGIALSDDRIVAVGETGLDFYYDHSPREVQSRLFREHCRAARATGLPLIVHTRDADGETADILEQEAAGGAKHPLRGVIHCFSGGLELAGRALSLGFYISFSGILTFKRSDELRAIAASVPLDRLLVETDAPYLAPVPKRGKRNEPAFVVHTGRVLADVKAVDEADLAARTTDNFHTLFDRVRR